MDTVEPEDDVGRALRTGYEVPPPRPEFAAELGRRLGRELAEGSGGARQREDRAGRAGPHRTIRLNRHLWLGAAAALVLAVALALVALHGRKAGGPSLIRPDAPVAHGTPGAGETERPGTGSKEDLVPLSIALPKPLFMGTDRNHAPRPTLEKFQSTRKPFLAPRGTVKVSLGKPVTASDKDPILGESAWLTDGDKSGVDDTFVDYGPGLQWVQVDLEGRCAIQAIVVWHYHARARVYHDVVVQVSDDADFIEGVRTIYNNDFDNSSGLGLGKDLEYIENRLGKLIDAKGVKARYVRLYSKGNTDNDQNHYVEVEVYGQAADAPEQKEQVAIRISVADAAPR